MKVQTYINFGGNCEQAVRFYEKHLGAQIIVIMKFKDRPETASIPGSNPDAVLHARIKLGETILMASDAPANIYQPMRSAYLSLGVESIEEAERIHAVLSEGGEIFMPMAETFYAHRFSMLRDKFGTNWMIIYEKGIAA